MTPITTPEMLEIIIKIIVGFLAGYSVVVGFITVMATLKNQSRSTLDQILDEMALTRGTILFIGGIMAMSLIVGR